MDVPQPLDGPYHHRPVAEREPLDRARGVGGAGAPRPDRGARTVLDAVGTVAVVWWGGDEVIRGVNPWRRALGAGAVAVTIAGMVS